MKNNTFLLEEVLRENNLLLDIKYDVIFKNVFLDNASRNYLCLFLNKILGYSYEELYRNMYLANIEISNNINEKSSYSDLLCRYKNINVIIEMNNSKSRKIINKNYHYLFKQHSSRNNNKNNYGENNETILINIDNYDLLYKKKLIYESRLRFKIYNNSIYKNIKIIHINLAYLRWKYFNNIKLNKTEKVLLIFIEQRKDRIRKIIINRDIEGVIEVIDRLKFEEHNGIVTYDREEYEKMLREEFEEEVERFKKKVTKFENKQTEFENKQTEFENKQTEFEKEKIEFKKKESKFLDDKEELTKTKYNIIHSLIKEGFSLEKISRLLKIPVDQIKTLL